MKAEDFVKYWHGPCQYSERGPVYGFWPEFQGPWLQFIHDGLLAMTCWVRVGTMKDRNDHELARFRFLQIKEKFGGCRIYFCRPPSDQPQPTDEQWEAITSSLNVLENLCPIYARSEPDEYDRDDRDTLS